MNPTIIFDFVNLFFAGLLTGALVVVDYGIGPAVATVGDEQTHIIMRQALIRPLRILVPIFFILTILSGVLITIMNWGDAAFIYRGAGVFAVVACFTLTLLGTAPINQAIGSWQPSAPPKDWRLMISKWERLDKIRTWVGILAFALLLTAVAFKLVAS